MKERYPIVMNEETTLNAALLGQSIARLGDGELRIVLGGSAPSQRPNAKLAMELRTMLRDQGPCVVCIPPLLSPTPKMWFWQTYLSPKFTSLYKDQPYGSTWITRADDAPWINTDEYWDKVRQLWIGKDVVLVTGDEKSLTPTLLQGAASVRRVTGPRQHAYSEIDRIQEEIGTPAGPVLMCLGATATALAYRLAQKGVHALDLGHLGMFMRRAEKAKQV